MFSRSYRWLMLLLFLLMISLTACGQDGGAPDAALARGDAALTAPAAAPDAETSDREEVERPRYDRDGVPLPSTRQALGVAVPLGFQRLNQDRRSVHYGGPIAPEKVLAFYRRYAECLDVRQTPRGWRLSHITPRAPGDPSRSVDLTIIRRRDGSSMIVVIDLMNRTKITIPDGSPETFEDLYQSAHKGSGSASRPIPGTY